ncbi:MAG: hypothetical protein AMXMBFR82_23480 [Candidatus Hydrogenedentota bacterium]
MIRIALFSPGSCRSVLMLSGLLVLALGCASGGGTATPAAPQSSKYQDVDRDSGLRVTEIEAQDISAAAQHFVRSMLADDDVMGYGSAPHVVMEAEDFVVNVSGRLNKEMLISRLRGVMDQEAKGQMILVTREQMDRILKEAELERQGLVGSGTLPRATRMLGSDFLLRGRIEDHDTTDGTAVEKFTQISIELYDKSSAQIVFSDFYDFKKRAAIHPANR